MRRWLVVLALVVGLVALLRSFPLAWAFPGAAAFLGTPSGTIWNGQITGVPLLGQVSVSTRPSGVRLDTPRAPATRQFSAVVRPGLLRDARLLMPVADLPVQDARLAGLRGTLGLDMAEARWDGNGCLEAQGTARTDVLAANGAQFGWSGPPLSGPVDCVEGRLRVRLSGEGDGAAVQASVVTGVDGVYRSEVTVRSDDSAAGNALALFGFARAAPGEYRLSEQGRWR